MISILIQNIIFAVLVVGLGFVIKIFNRRFKGLVNILVGVILLWFTSILNIIFGLDIFSFFILILGIAVGLHGLFLLSRELKVKGLGVDSVESAMNSIVKIVGARAGLIFSIFEKDKSFNCIYNVGDIDDGTMMISIPIESEGGIIGYIILYGDKPFAEFNRTNFETELGIIKLWVENHRLSEKIKAFEKENEILKMEVEKVKKDLFKYTHFVVHELKKPLTGIIGFSKILRDEFKNLSEDDALEFIGNIKQAGEEMLKTIECLQKISEIKLGEFKLNLERFNLIDEINKVIGRIKKEIDEKNLSVVLNVSENLEIEADRGKFTEIVYQLLSNVVKPLHENLTIKISACEIGDWIELSIENVGFNQRAKFNSKAFGLGFEIIELLVKLHCGKVSVEDDYDRGAKFKILFPLKREEKSESRDDYRVEVLRG